MNEQKSDRAPVVGELVEEVKAKSTLSTLMVIIVGALMVLYLLNPFVGVVELLPDNLPILGNIDEVAATTILLGCLSYFGIELPWLRKPTHRSNAQSTTKD